MGDRQLIVLGSSLAGCGEGRVKIVFLDLTGPLDIIIMRKRVCHFSKCSPR